MNTEKYYHKLNDKIYDLIQEYLGDGFEVWRTGTTDPRYYSVHMDYECCDDPGIQFTIFEKGES